MEAKLNVCRRNKYNDHKISVTLFYTWYFITYWCKIDNKAESWYKRMNFGHSANNTNRDLGMLHCLLSETSYRINSTLSINKYTSDNSCLRSINRGGFSLKKVSRVLLQKSQEAFLLALEIYNKPTITYRMIKSNIMCKIPLVMAVTLWARDKRY